MGRRGAAAPHAAHFAGALKRPPLGAFGILSLSWRESRPEFCLPATQANWQREEPAPLAAARAVPPGDHRISSEND